MVSSILAMAPVILFLAVLLFLKGTFGKLECEKLSADMCAFAVSSSGKRCSLETQFSNDRTIKFECKTSDIMAGVNLYEHIESSDCLNSCGVERETVGISTDKFLEPQFSKKLCSQGCQLNCLNIVDLYSRLALAEGVYLPAVCKALAATSRREMKQMQIHSSGAVPRRQKTMEFLNYGSANKSGAIRNLNDVATESGVALADAASTIATDSDAEHHLNHGATNSGDVPANAASRGLALAQDCAEAPVPSFPSST